MIGSKVIVRLKGGLGNQLFCYAAARRLAWANNAELVIDDKSGFVRDYRYRRTYALNEFHITARGATASERMEPFERLRRSIAKFIARRQRFPSRRYIEEDGAGFDPRLRTLRVRGTVYLDGYWQSENYFKDAEDVIKQDLRIDPPQDAENQRMAHEISASNAIGLHVRWFDKPAAGRSDNNLEGSYYARAAGLIMERVVEPKFYVFSDHLGSVGRFLNLPADRTTLVGQNRGDALAYADLWLMTKCKHFVIANSTFSWWGAWLGENKAKIVFAPAIELRGTTAWGFDGLIPKDWEVI